MTLEQDMLSLVPQTKTAGQHLSIDTFLRSLAENRASCAIGVILSGTAADGTFGLQAIKAQGGITLAQEAHSAKFSGMPQSAIAAGCVDFIGSPEQIARELIRISSHPYVCQPPEEEETTPRVHGRNLPVDERDFQHIVQILRRKTSEEGLPDLSLCPQPSWIPLTRTLGNYWTCP